MNKERQGELLMLGITLLESWFPIFSISAMKYIGALHTYLYSLIIAFVFFILLMFRGNKFAELKNRDAYKDLLLTTFYITTLFTFVFIGMQYTSAGNVAVIIMLQLLFSYIYFNLFGKEKIDALHLVGIFFMGAGALVILFPDEFSFNKGDLLILLASMIAPLANFYQKKARKFCSSETILGFRTLVGLPFIFILAISFEPSVDYENFILALPYLLFIGVVIYVVSKIMWIEALHRISITKVSAMMGLVPMMTLFFAYLYLDEVPQMRQLLGVLPIVIGGYLLTKPSST
ncbi:MAG: DMT family transporter [Sulfurimonas sp.]|nr:DMT family transporter [Sulfurimonas sp.]